MIELCSEYFVGWCVVKDSKAEAKVHNEEVEVEEDRQQKCSADPQKMLLIPTYVQLESNPPKKSKIQRSKSASASAAAKHAHKVDTTHPYNNLKPPHHDELQNHLNQPRRIGKLLSYLT